MTKKYFIAENNRRMLEDQITKQMYILTQMKSLVMPNIPMDEDAVKLVNDLIEWQKKVDIKDANDFASYFQSENRLELKEHFYEDDIPF